MNVVYPHWKSFLPHPFTYFYQCDKCSLYGETNTLESTFEMANNHNKEYHKKTLDCRAGIANLLQYSKDYV